MITLPELFSSYLKIQGVSSVSIRNYRCDLKHFLGWLILTLKGHNLPTFENDDIKLVNYYFNSKYVSDYKEFLQSNSLPSSTINRRLSTLRSFANYCLNQGYISLNPVENLNNITPEPERSSEKLPGEDLLSLFQQSLNQEAISSNTIKNYLSDIREYLTFIQVGSNSNHNFFNRINSDSLSSFKYFLATKGASESSIKRVESSLRKFCAWGVKERYLLKNPFENKSLFSFPFTIRHLPLTIKSYRALPYFTYLNFLILVIFLGALGFGLYQQFIVKAPQNLAFPNAPVAPKRYLSFQGRLTDSSGNPLENAITFQFQIYDAPSVDVPPTGGNLLWNSGDCSIDPDQDGIFSSILGSSCGSEITSSVFTENAQAWLQIKVGTETLSPRIQIATVAYALNSETLQGFPIASMTNADPNATMGATARTIPAINPAGNLILASASPALWSTSGTFQIKGQALSIVTATGTNGNINLAPDGAGTVNLTFSSLATGSAINAQAAQLGTSAGKEFNNLIYGKVANSTNNYNLLKLESGSTPTAKFTVDYAGNASMAGALNVFSTITANTTGTINGININTGTISNATWTGNAITTTYGGSGQNWGSVTVGNLPYFNGTGSMTTLAPGSTGFILQTNGAAAPTWIDPATLPSASLWTLGSGSIYPKYSTVDLILGSTATSSALTKLPGTNKGSAWINFGGGTSDTFSASASGTTKLAVNNGGLNVYGYATASGGLAVGYTSMLAGPNAVFAGSVGIGTTAPTEKLVVSGGTIRVIDQTSAARQLILGSDGTNAFNFYNNGGAGTANALTQAGDKIFSFTNGTIETGNLVIGPWSASAYGMRMTNTGKVGFNYADPGTAQVAINGNVGIGTTSPSATLDIVGNLEVNGYATMSSSLAVGYSSVLAGVGNAAFAGKVGIGTTNPLYKLEIAGDLNVATKSAFLSVDNMQLSSLEGGAYFGRVGLKENQWGLNNYSEIWTSKGIFSTWQAIALSSDGKYQTAVEKGDESGGYIWISSDYGNNWTQKGSSLNWESIAMSSDGKIQTAVVSGGYIWISSDYGNNWTQKGSSLSWGSVAMSSDGKIQTAVVSGGYIWISSDYGNNWTQKGSSLSWWSVAMSSDGKIQTAVVSGGYIWISSDYGNNWTQKGSSDDWESVAMSSDGKIQTAVADTTGNGYIWISSDYGNNWTQKGSYARWWSVAMSSDGKIQTAVTYNAYIWMSTDYGNNWTQKGSSQLWTSVAMSSDGKIQTAVVSGGYIWISRADSYIYGNIGIGTTAPSYKLDVVGNASVSGNLMAGGQLRAGQFAAAPLTAGAGSLYYNAGDNTLYLSNGSTWTAVGSGSQYWQLNAGVLSPAAITNSLLLGSTATSSALVNLPGLNKGSAWINFGGGSSDAFSASASGTTKLAVNNGGLNVYGYATASGGLAVGYTSMLAGPNIVTTGSVGIGTSNPSEKLDVVGDIEVSGVGQFGGIIGVNYNAMSDAGTAGLASTDNDLYIEDILEVDGTAYLTNTYFGGSTTYGITSSGVGTLNTAETINGLSINAASLTDVVNINMTGYATASGGLAIGYSSLLAGPNAVFRGSVGIGTSNPGSALDIVGNATVSGNLTFYGGVRTLGSTNMNNLIIGGATTGNIILNPANAAAGGAILPNTTNVTDLGTVVLQFRNIYGQNIYSNGVAVTNYWQRAGGEVTPADITNSLLLGSTATSSALVNLPGLNKGSAWINFGGGTSNTFSASASGTTKLAVNNGGLNVYGYATTSGSLAVGYTSVLAGTGNAAFAGNVGIGTTNPGHKLQVVAGTMATQINALNITGTFQSSSTAVEDGALISMTSAGSQGDPTQQRALTVNLGSGYTGNGLTAAMRFANSAAGTGTGGISGGYANYGAEGITNGTTTGHNIGLLGQAESGNLNAGVVGQAFTAKANATNYGVYGTSYNNGASGLAYGGFFTLATGTSADGAALVADNANFANDVFRAVNGTTSYLVVKNGGNVGIGTTNPSYKLDVVGNASFSGNLMAGGQLRSGQFASAPLSAGAGSMYYNMGDSTLYISNGSTWTAVGSGTQYWQTNLGALSPANISNDLLIGGIATTSANFAFINNWGSTAVASISGNLVLASTPGTVRTISSTNNTPLALNPSGGNVGIGLTTPQSLLDIKSPSFSSTAIRLTKSNSSVPIITLGEDQNNNGNFQVISSGQTDKVLINPYTSYFYGGGSTKVGIGTTNPLATLDVTGTASVSSNLYLGSSIRPSNSPLSFDYKSGINTWTTGMTMLNNGNIGIGTANPTSKLYISGLSGNLFTIFDGLMEDMNVSSTSATINVPTSFTAAGDTSMAYDLQFTNPVTSYIKSLRSLYLEAGEPFNSSSLTLRTFNKGNVVIDSEALVVNYSATISGQLNVAGNATVSGNLMAGGQLRSGQFASAPTSAGAGSMYYNMGDSTLYISNGSTWTAAGSGGSSNWQRIDGALSPLKIADSLLLGATATSSALVNLPGLNKGSAWINFGGGTSDAFSASSSGTTRFYVNSSGNVGIGTTSPQYKLDVKGGFMVSTEDGSVQIDVQNTTQETTAGSTITGQSFTATKYGDLAYFDVMWTTTPSNSFTVRNGENINGTILASSTGVTSLGSSWYRIALDTNPRINPNQLYTIRYDAGNYSAYISQNNPYSGGRFYFSGNWQGWDMAFKTYILGNSISLFLADNNSRSVGIGTTSPSALLDVAGTASVSALTIRGTSPGYINQVNDNNLIFRTSVSGDAGLTDRMTLTNTGNVGIGTTTPAAKLDIVGNLNVSTYATVGASLAVGYTNALAGTGNAIFSGNVGVGTTSPGTKLEVVGSSWLRGDTGTTTSGLFVDLSGNIGIGTGNTNLESVYYLAPGETKFLTTYANSTYGTCSSGKETIVIRYRTSSTNSVDALLIHGALITQTYTLPASTSLTTYTDGSCSGAWTGPGNLDLSLKNNSGTDGLYVSTLKVRSYLTGTYFYTLASLGNLYVLGDVGIGTTNPSYKLDVQGGYANASSGLCINGDCKTSWASVGGGYWQRPTNTGIVAPLNITDSLLLGGIATSSALVNLPGLNKGSAWINFGGGTSDTFSASASGTTRLAVNNGGLNVYGYATASGGLAIGYTSMLAGPNMVIAGSVGIGTSNPSKALEVVGNIAVSGGNAGNLALQFIGDPNTGLFQEGGDKISLVANGQGGLTFDGTSGAFEVGMGTNAPAYPVDIQASHGTRGINLNHYGTKTAADYGVYLANASDSTTNSINKYGLYITSTGTWTGTSANNYGLYVDTVSGGTNNYAAIFASGNVGIGTTTPAEKLDIVGNLKLSGYATSSASLAVGNVNAKAGVGNISANGSIYADRFVENYGESSQFFLDPGAAKSLNLAGYATAGASLAVGYSSVPNGVGNAAFSGSVGIGTTNPTAKLEVNGSIYTGDGTAAAPGYAFTSGPSTGMYRISGSSLGFSTVGVERMRLWASGGFALGTYIATDPGAGNMIISGNVGIGTTAPLHRLSVGTDTVTAANASIAIKQTGSGDGFISQSSVNDDYIRMLHSGSLGIISTTYQATGGYTPLTFWTSDVEKMRIDTAGNVGIGTTNPTSKLYVSGVSGNLFTVFDGLIEDMNVASTSATFNVPTSFTAAGDTSMAYDLNFVNPTASYIKSAAPLYVQAGETFGSSDLTLRTFNFGDINLEASTGGKLTLKANTGYVGIGTAAPATPLEIYSNQAAPTLLQLKTTSTQRATLIFAPSGNAWEIGARGSTGSPNNAFYLYDQAATAYRMVVDSGGNVGIGTTAPSVALHVVGNGRFTAIGSGTYSNVVNQTSDGTLTTATSDIRLKKDISTINNALDKVMKLRGITFNWTDPSNPKRMTGMIAQEVIDVMPELVFQNPNDGYYGLLYGETSGLLVEAIKEQQLQISSLSEQLAALDNQTLNDTGDLNIIGPDGQTVGASENQSFSLSDAAGQLIQRVGAFSEAVIANIQAGIIQTQVLIADNLIVNQKMVSPIVETNEIGFKNQDLGFKNKDGETVMKIDENGQTTHFGDLLVQGNSSVSGQISADSLQINTDATVAGTLYADEIVTRHGKFGDLLANQIAASTVSAQYITNITNVQQTTYNIIQSTPSASASESATPTPDLSAPISSESALLISQADTWTLSDITEDLKITTNLQVIGHSSLADTTVAGNLMIDGEMNINAYGINSITGPLYLNPLGFGGIDMLAGKVVIDVEGNVQIAGTLAAKEIKALPDSDLTLNLERQNIDRLAAPESGFGKLLVKGIGNETVASIDAEGNAAFKKITIAADYTATQSAYWAEVTTNATSGKGVLPAWNTEFTVYNPKVSNDTLIYVTPEGSTQNKVLYVSAKQAEDPVAGIPGYFKIAVDSPIDTDIQFNWWIIN